MAPYTTHARLPNLLSSVQGSMRLTIEIRLVLETLAPLAGDRKCFRMINGVLVERTVKDVTPQLRTNTDGLKQVLDDLLKQYQSKQEELEKWKVRIVDKIHAICY